MMTQYINRNNPDKWKEDIKESVDFYNNWFLNFAPKTYKKTRLLTTEKVKETLAITNNLSKLTSKIILGNPEILTTLRMSTCPPIARDRLIGLAYASPNLVKKLEQGELPKRMKEEKMMNELGQICKIIHRLLDKDIFTWLSSKGKVNQQDVNRAATIIADRLCGSMADPIIRNEQERRQLRSIEKWLKKKKYKKLDSKNLKDFREMPKGTFIFHYNVPIDLNSDKKVNIAVDIIVNPFKSKKSSLPLLIEAKSAGDFTNVNKRRKEEAVKMSQLKNTYGNKIVFNLFLCGYFDSGYLGYEAAEGIDWVWEHRIDDLAKMGI